MSLKMNISTTHAKPGTLLSGTITLRPDAGAVFDIQTFSISLLGISKTRIITDNGPSKKSPKAVPFS